MSATNRGNKRRESDFYATPLDCIRNVLDNLNLSNRGTEVLEPSAGNGNIVQIFKKYYPDKNITALELREEERNNLSNLTDNVIIDNFLERNIINKYDIIIGNPPYGLAIEFVKKSLKSLKDDGILIFLLRTAFLESRTRYEFWQENPLTGLLTLSKRPSFTGKGTDATSYSWFVWDKSTKEQYIKII